MTLDLRGSGGKVPGVDPWSGPDLREKILGGQLEEILGELATGAYAALPDEARAFLLRGKRMELVRARLLEVVSAMPVFEPLAIIERIRDYLPAAFGSEVVNFSEYLGGDHISLRRESDAPIREGKLFRNRFGDFGHPLFERAAREKRVLQGQVTERERNRNRYRTDAFMVVPVVVQDQTLGILSFADKAAQALYGRLDEEELGRFARTFGNTLTDKVEKSHDGLTGLLNRTRFVQALDDLLASSRRGGTPLSVVYADLDHFKEVNDRFGHAVGDQVLRELARILAGAVRYAGPVKDLVGRMGGEEFCLALPLPEGPAVDRARVIHARIREYPFASVGRRTASLGVRSWTPAEHGISVDDLIRQADEAMYHRKQHGRDGVTLHREISAAAR
ncbi:MAG: sensor domain-containing diguanylate cyclase [Deltaproteobacteria bacterium]|nr:sensor domain-containing diguanylate cyclase [Deltaproteobacteria bacterium]